MFFEAIVAAGLVALTSIVGAFFFGSHRGLVGAERFVVPIAVGVFLSLVLFELIPETIDASPEWGGIVVAGGFVLFYLIAQYLHKRFHDLGDDNCDRKSSAILLLIGDAFHNLADGIVLGGAFIVDPALGIATAIGLAIHEVPQEIVEFGVLIRAGYSRMEAVVRNLISASTILIGTVLTLLLAEVGEQWIWVITGVAAGNLLFLAASDLLPRIHGTLHKYGSIWYATGAIIAGFVLMTITIEWTHSQFGHGHDEYHIDEAHEVEEAH